MSVEIAADLRISASTSLNATNENEGSDDSYNIFVTIVIITFALSFLVILIDKAIIFPARNSTVSTAPTTITNSNNKKFNKSCNFNTF